MRALLITTALVAAAFAAVPAEAASKSTARVSGTALVRSGPGVHYSIVGKLADKSRVHLERCTHESNWCLVLDPDGDELGWVRGSFLVGWAAKIQVSPPDLFPSPLEDPLFMHMHKKKVE